MPASLIYVYVQMQILQISQCKAALYFRFSQECWNSGTGELSPLDGTVMSFFTASATINSCVVYCVKNGGNINFFALENPNISRNDINTITTQTQASLISSVTGLYPLAPILQ